MRSDRVQRPLSAARALDALHQLHDVKVNFELGCRDQCPPEKGWRIDDHRVALPREPPGPPVPCGSWETARRLLADYEFADPSIVRAVYHPEDPLEGRTMLLEGRFYWMRFVLGVRIDRVIDQVRSVGGRPAQVWGWSYRTLHGHLEMGQMDYEVCKWFDSGEVEFRIHAFSKRAAIPNLIVRFGFRVFGRHMQKKFVRQALARMDRLVRSALEARATGHTPAE